MSTPKRSRDEQADNAVTTPGRRSSRRKKLASTSTSSSSSSRSSVASASAAGHTPSQTAGTATPNLDELCDIARAGTPQQPGAGAGSAVAFPVVPKIDWKAVLAASKEVVHTKQGMFFATPNTFCFMVCLAFHLLSWWLVRCCSFSSFLLFSTAVVHFQDHRSSVCLLS